MKNILDPLQEKIKLFEKRVEENNEKSLMRHSSLTEQLRHLRELNEKITKEASNLTRALKGDTKMQGNWGELVLERVLEKSGLEKDSEYFVQNSFTTEEGKRVMPDVIISLPDNKKMIIDSKVSLIELAVGVGHYAGRWAHGRPHARQLLERNRRVGVRDGFEIGPDIIECVYRVYELRPLQDISKGIFPDFEFK